MMDVFASEAQGRIEEFSQQNLVSPNLSPDLWCVRECVACARQLRQASAVQALPQCLPKD